MRKQLRPAIAAVVALGSVLAIAACGSSSTNTSSGGTGTSGAAAPATSGKSGGTVTLLMGTAPQSLDPGMDYTTQGAEDTWISYLGLLTYKHANGIAGGQVIPGLATGLPKISDGGKTYTLTLRKGLTFSNGKPVKASDFTYTVERAIKIPWGGSGLFITPNIAGATAYANGKAKTISGITTNDGTGQITIHLTNAYGPFANILAFPSLGLVPTGTPFKNLANNPPPGVGPYMTTNVVPNQSFEATQNPAWAKMNIPGIPAGHVKTIQVKIDSNVSSNALSVLNNSADVFDWADTIPGSLLAQIKAKAGSRFKLVDLGGSTYYIFFNSQNAPFNNQLAREAVVTGLNENAMNRLGSGTLQPACFFLPPLIPGHPSATCPYGNPASGGNIAKAKQLVKQSGQANVPITVWSETRQPRQAWMTYYTQFLKSIGFTNVTEKVIADATYFTTIGEEKKLHPQTGFADWNMDFPNPYDFYLLVDGHSILPTNNENFGETNDPQINSQVAKLGPTPTPQLDKVKSQWQALDEYVAKKAYLAVFGYQTFPFFTSDRINYGAVIRSPLYGWDWTSFQLK
ncbi:MAG TPA: ABC transporter substrate-binding protein [Solirubrobacteraceae bacterium]|jgi:peptide/nickel transport system substrate-binding protein